MSYNLSNQLIFEAYFNYSLPNSGVKKFSDFYLSELLYAKLRQKHGAERDLRLVKEMRDTISYELGKFMVKYLRAACLTELGHIADEDATTIDIWSVRDNMTREEYQLYKRDQNIFRITYIIDNLPIQLDNEPDELIRLLTVLWDVALKGRGMRYDDIMELYNHMDVDGIFNSLGDDIVTLFEAPGINTSNDGNLPPNKSLWENMYGGEEWASIAKATNEAQRNVARWEKTNNEQVEYRLIQFIDHIYDMQHNTGSVLNKSKQVDVPKVLLDMRANANSPGLARKLSPTLRIEKLVRRHWDTIVRNESDDDLTTYKSALKDLALKFVEASLVNNESIAASRIFNIINKSRHDNAYEDKAYEYIDQYPEMKLGTTAGMNLLRNKAEALRSEANEIISTISFLGKKFTDLDNVMYFLTKGGVNTEVGLPKEADLGPGWRSKDIVNMLITAHKIPHKMVDSPVSNNSPQLTQQTAVRPDSFLK